MRFNKHYTIEQATQLLPRVREWLETLIVLREQTEEQVKLVEDLAEGGADIGGAAVNSWVQNLAKMQTVWLEFFKREIQVKDIDRGLVDFPALLNGREVFLCWERCEEDIKYWHDLDAGYAGRQRFEDS